ncbi:hypothetical protein P9112_013411 [Eukaryota sp. TZLM1-RC]
MPCAKSFNIEAFIEPLVRKLSSDQTDDSFGKKRADLVAPGIDGVLNVVDVVSVDCIPLIRRYLTPKKKKIVCKLSLKECHGSAKQCLFSTELVECDENTAQLNKLHSFEVVKYPEPNGSRIPYLIFFYQNFNFI